MDLTTLFSNVEASQTAKTNGAAQLSNDQAKAAAIAQAIQTDQSNLTTLTATADSDIQAAITALQGLLSTAPVPAPAPAPAPAA